MRCVEEIVSHAVPRGEDVPWKNPGVRGSPLRVSLEKGGRYCSH